ncbi:hypothetical protein LCGC14_2363770 [marine sediment metagenome]|uniref:Uncharacterized protein n=1 Tax=marine sediment metagenome TaxID=412755 RepID=A0A0F9CT80_9ZZZZ
MSEWLDNLKVGDRVIIQGRLAIADSVSTVERFTKTLIIIKSGIKFRKDGHAPGQWPTAMLTEPTPERLDVIRQRNLAYYLKTLRWRDLPLAKLVEVHGLLTKGT